MYSCWTLDPTESIPVVYSSTMRSVQISSKEEDCDKEWLEDSVIFIQECSQLSSINPQRVYILLDLNSCFPAFPVLPMDCHCFAFGSSPQVSRMLKHPLPRRLRLVPCPDPPSYYISTFCGSLVKQWRSKGVLVVLISDDLRLRKDLLRQFSCWKILGAGFSSRELDCLRGFLSGLLLKQ
jgi:hypothetical protein